jgi:hypothetical protein
LRRSSTIIAFKVEILLDSRNGDREAIFNVGFTRYSAEPDTLAATTIGPGSRDRTWNPYGNSNADLCRMGEFACGVDQGLRIRTSYIEKAAACTVAYAEFSSQVWLRAYPTTVLTTTQIELPNYEAALRQFGE